MKYEVASLKKFTSSFNLFNHTFFLLFVFGLVTAINLTLYWRVEKDTNECFLQLLLYGSILFRTYSRRNNLNLITQFPANLIGCCLIIIPFLTANFSNKEMSVSWYFLPLINFTGLALLASGFSGIKLFNRELMSIFTFPVMWMISRLLEITLPITVISAKITSFILWYLGFNSYTQGTLVYVNGGWVDVLWRCTAIPLLILLLKFSALLILLFPNLLRNIYLPGIFSVVISSVASIIRLVIMALVVTDKPAFDYWHGTTGGNLFAMGSFMLFGMLIIMLRAKSNYYST